MRSIILIVTALMAVGVTPVAGQVSGDRRVETDVDTRPLDPRQDPPSLSERARGAEAALPVVVQRSIEGDPELRTQNVKVAGNERRNITLSGEVSDPRLKAKAQRLAQSVAGVQHVHNNIVVLGTPESFEDDPGSPRGSDPLHVMPERE